MKAGKGRLMRTTKNGEVTGNKSGRRRELFSIFIVVTDTELVSVRTSESGVFEALVKAGEEVKTGQPLANIIHPYESELIETLYAPVDSRIFFIHNAPLTYANTAVIKLVR